MGYTFVGAIVIIAAWAVTSPASTAQTLGIYHQHRHHDRHTIIHAAKVAFPERAPSTTPNSVRAEQNLMAALSALDDAGAGLGLEIVDVFTNPRRALRDGVIVTPMLIGMTAIGRLTMIGELTDAAKLALFLRTLWDEQAIKAIKTPAVE